jgi:hypothetical protein
MRSKERSHIMQAFSIVVAFVENKKLKDALSGVLMKVG